MAVTLTTTMPTTKTQPASRWSRPPLRATSGGSIETSAIVPPATWIARSVFIMAGSLAHARNVAHVPEVTAGTHDFRHPRPTAAPSYNRPMSSASSPDRCDAFVPALADPPQETAAATRSMRWFIAAAVVTWIACGLWPGVALFRRQFTGWPAAVFVAVFAIYGAAMAAILWLPYVRRVSQWVPVTLAMIQTVTALVINVDTNVYLGGTGMGLGLVVIVAAELPWFIGGATLWIWIVGQSVALTWLLIFATRARLGALPSLWDLVVEGLMFGLAAVGFQVFAAASTILALSEGRARTKLARANAELTATRELLEESGRTSERMRISRDLHDTLGHHLTALSLQLDVATRLSQGMVAEHIQQAHAITRLLLSDVRDVVSTLRETSKLNLADAIRALAVQPAGAAVHLDMPGSVIVEDASRAEAILRAVQEVLTNAARHAHADNLWLRLEATPAGVTLYARDDGRGAGAFTAGNGLRGMRERFEQYGGHVEAGPTPGGFEVRALMPIQPSA
ncbi:MAG TPA: sensor histidine kinase [Vicinamibacterales bacterium]|nr:sensor histidine kinase [Vicinamibacterales bacterium]